MISTDDLGEWLRANGLPADAAITTDGEIPAMPDRLVVLTGTGGQGTSRERTFDNPAVQVITRDGQRSSQATEALAGLVDDLLMGQVPPLQIGGKRVISIDQQGGGPAFLDRDEGLRVLYVCSYLFEVARDVH